MTARLPVKRSQLRALAAVAREEGCVAEMECGGVIYRLTPEALTRAERAETVAADVDSGQEFELD